MKKFIFHHTDSGILVVLKNSIAILFSCFPL